MAYIQHCKWLCLTRQTWQSMHCLAVFDNVNKIHLAGFEDYMRIAFNYIAIEIDGVFVANFLKCK